MAESAGNGRTCATCGSALSRFNIGPWCANCSPIASADGPPEMPAEFWDHGPLREGLANWHIGAVIEAYRNHPAHGQPLSQIQVGHGWI